MKQGSTLYLRICILLIALPVLAICIFWLPSMIAETKDLRPEYMSFRYILVGVYISALPFFYALLQALRLLKLIEKGTAFSDMSVQALKNIKLAAIAICIIYLILIPFALPIADADDAPGLMGIPLLVVFASSIVGVFSALLQRLLQEAVEIKSENELTV